MPWMHRSVAFANILVPRALALIVTNKSIWLTMKNEYSAHAQKFGSGHNLVPRVHDPIGLRQDAWSLLTKAITGTGNEISLARGLEPWCLPEGLRPLGTGMTH